MSTLIDKDDEHIMNGRNWNAYKGRNDAYYVKSDRKHLHREIMNVTNPKVQIDHINGDTLDNRKINLRVTDQRGNSKNMHMYKNNKTGVNGVSLETSGGKYRYRVKWEGDVKQVSKSFSFKRNDFESQLDALSEAIATRTIHDALNGYTNGERPKDFYQS